MLILELSGLPGCGKSTLIDSVVEKLSDPKIRIATRNDVYYFNCKNKDKKSALFKTFLKLNNYRIYREILKINRKYSKRMKCLKYAFQFMMLISQIQETEKSNKYDIAILDEGIIQYFSAQADDTTFTDNKRIQLLLEMICKKIRNWTVVKCDVDVDVAIKRIKGRKVSSNRFSASKSNEVLHKLLMDRNKNLEHLYSYKCDNILNMNNALSENTAIITEYINQVLGGNIN